MCIRDRFYSWRGEGNGVRISIRRKGNEVIFFEKSDKKFDFKKFEEAVLLTANQLIEFILKYVVEQSVLIFLLIEAKNFRIALAIIQFFNEK